MHIHVFHDTVCPWCRIGKANLQRALDQWTGEPVTVSYHAFFLNPDIPLEGHDFRAYMTAKGGGQVPLNAWFDGPRRAGEAAGLTFDFEAITRAPNPTDSHRLITMTPETARPAMIDAIYAAYFEYGRDIGSHDVLADIARSQGLDAEAVREGLAGDAGRADVLADVRRAQQVGISGVPFFVLDNTFAFSGAQPPQAILNALEQIVAFRADPQRQGKP